MAKTSLNDNLSHSYTYFWVYTNTLKWVDENATKRVLFRMILNSFFASLKKIIL